jgi:hypothetical protein
MFRLAAARITAATEDMVTAFNSRRVDASADYATALQALRTGLADLATLHRWVAATRYAAEARDLSRALRDSSGGGGGGSGGDGDDKTDAEAAAESAAFALIGGSLTRLLTG